MITNFLNRKINTTSFTDFIHTTNSELTERTLVGDTEDDFNYETFLNKKSEPQKNQTNNKVDDDDSIIDTFTSKTNDFKEYTVTETTVKDNKKNNVKSKHATVINNKLDPNSVFIKCPKN